MRKVVLTLKEKEKYDVIKKLVETNGNKKRAANKLKITERQINHLIVGYKEFGKQFFVHGNRGRKPSHALSVEQKNQIEDLYNTKLFTINYSPFTIHCVVLTTHIWSLHRFDSFKNPHFNRVSAPKFPILM